jgi:tellurite resistance protein
MKICLPKRIQYFPITFFAVALGFSGFTLAVQKSEEVFSVSHTGSTALLWITLLLFISIGLLYGAKALFCKENVYEELMHPVKINFFPLIAKVMLVLSIVFLTRNKPVSYYLWIAGTALQFIASLTIISTWMHQTHFKIEHLTPGWFIPIVGSLIIPIAGVSHGFPEISWFFFSVGLLFWIMLFTVVMYRIIFHPPIVSKLLPTMFIIFAPPAIGFIAYVKLTGGIDSFGRILYYASFFMLLLVLSKVYVFFKIEFYLSWWAYSFPLAAVTLSTIQMYHLQPTIWFKYLIVFELLLLSIVIVVLTVLTFKAVIKRQICVEE